MNNEENIKRFEELLGRVNREGMDKLIAYCQKSDFYTAPSSTKYHLSVSGGLLQHSLNVYDALKAMLRDNGDGTYSYLAAGREVANISEESLTVITLLHDLCKTHFYATEKRNRKVDGKWEEYNAYTIADEIPYGHGEKSVLMIDTFIRLSLEEKMSVRWHMGFPEDSTGKLTFSQAVDKFPIVWALHNADMQAAHFIEDNEDNKELFR